MILSNGAIVSAGEGDDLICLTGRRGITYSTSDAGPGDDRVINKGGAARVDLGSGVDRYQGSGAPDYVVQSRRGTGGESDTISTGGGPDRVDLYNSLDAPAAVNDRVNLGAGADELLISIPHRTASASLSGGPGKDILVVAQGRPATGAWQWSNRAGTASNGDWRLSWRKFESFDLRSMDSVDSLSYTGNDANELLLGHRLSNVTMGRGGDAVSADFVRGATWAGGQAGTR